MNQALPDPSPSARLPRKEGEDSRARLLQAGLRLFAHQGFAKTSTRELAHEAQCNIAAISYYFGDKAGLYRAVFFEPLGSPADDIALYSNPQLSLEQALQGFFASFLEPLRQGDVARLCMKLHFREMLEPTGLWEEEIAQGIRPMHDALVAVLCRHFGLAEADDELLRLAVCLAGMGVHLHVGRDITNQIAPSLNAGPDAIDHWAQTLVRYGMAMVAAEQARRDATGAEA